MCKLGQSQKTVSVVIATYNGSDFIADQLNSIIKQSLRPIEIIVSDDGSTDDTVNIVTSISKTSAVPISLLINNRKLGFRDNFLSASKNARGSFIAFCDQDDIWALNKLELSSRYFDNRAVSMIVHSADSFDHLTGKVFRFSQGIRTTIVKPPLSYDPWQTFFGFSIVFRRELLYLFNTDNRFIDFIVPSEKIAHDRWIMFLAQVVGSTVELDIPLVQYRQHAKNLFGDGRNRTRSAAKDPVRILDDYILATSNMIDVIKKLPDRTTADFPLFDRTKALFFFERALRQLECRKTVYVASNRLNSARNLTKNVRMGVYKSIHSNSTRWRSIIRDIKYCMTRS